MQRVDTNHLARNSRDATDEPQGVHGRQRWIVLAASFFGWMFAGMEISLFVLIARPAVRSLVPAASEADVGGWFAWYQCAFLLGAAAGGWLFGWLGDRIGRTRAMAASILCYSLVTGMSYPVESPTTLLLLRFIACLGVGGVWPSAVSLAVEGLPTISKPLLAGLMGAAANVGFVLLGLVGYWFAITPDSWRWVLLVGASPALLGVFALFCVAESPSWLAAQRRGNQTDRARPMHEIMRPPLLRRTLIGIALGAIPVIGTSANANWLIPWSDQVAGSAAVEQESKTPGAIGSVAEARRDDPHAKAWTQVTRSGGAIIGSLLGGWIASLLGRRLTYFLISLVSFLISSYIFRFLTPLDRQFSLFTFLLGFVGVTYFGWLPLYLPELFPTRVRSTGTGVTFNSGRVLAAVSVLGAGALMQAFSGDYARVGTFTGLVYVLGMIVVCFAPDTTKDRVED
jgi:MFS family permease